MQRGARFLILFVPEVRKRDVTILDKQKKIRGRRGKSLREGHDGCCASFTSWRWKKKAEGCACPVHQWLAETGSGCNALIIYKDGDGRIPRGSISSYPGSTEWRKIPRGKKLASLLHRVPRGAQGYVVRKGQRLAVRDSRSSRRDVLPPNRISAKDEA